MPKGKQGLKSLKSVPILMTTDLLMFSSFLPLKGLGPPLPMDFQRPTIQDFTFNLRVN